MEVERGDGVSDALQAVPRRCVLGTGEQQRARLGARHQPVRGLIWDLDSCEAQDGAAVDGLRGSETQRLPERRQHGQSAKFIKQKG